MSDLDQVIDRITDNVLKELARRGIGGSCPSCCAPPAAPPALTRARLASMIDHTLLRPEATREQVTRLCREALQHGFASVCVNSQWVRTCADILRGSAVKTCTVVGFPLGAVPPDAKAYETRRAILDGATEIDMVLNIGAMKSGDHATVERDIRGVVAVAEEYGVIVKVILETCLLEHDEKVMACRLSQAAGAHFVKTSTGFASGGATEEDVRLMRQTVGSALQVKASGGVKTLEDAVRMIQAGAARLGTSSGVRIVQALPA